MQPALIVEEIIKKFGDFMAVNKVSFHVEDGSFFSILGPAIIRSSVVFPQPDGPRIEKKLPSST